MNGYTKSIRIDRPDGTAKRVILALMFEFSNANLQNVRDGCWDFFPSSSIDFVAELSFHQFVPVELQTTITWPKMFGIRARNRLAA